MFHHESDHTVGGFRYPIEAQIIYKSDDITKAGKKAMISILFHDEIGEKNPFMESFAFDMLNGYAKYEGSQGLDLSTLFDTNGSSNVGSGGDNGNIKGNGSNKKKEDCSKANISTSASSEQTIGTNGSNSNSAAELGTLVKFD